MLGYMVKIVEQEYVVQNDENALNNGVMINCIGMLNAAMMMCS